MIWFLTKKTKNTEQEINKNSFIYIIKEKGKSKTFDLKKFKTIGYFGKEIYSGVIAPKDMFEEQIILKKRVMILIKITNEKT